MPVLVKIDQGLWVNPQNVMAIGASDSENTVQITMRNGGHIHIEDANRGGATAAAVADQIAAIINGSGH